MQISTDIFSLGKVQVLARYSLVRAPILYTRIFVFPSS
jgi:hypothetical protein